MPARPPGPSRARRRRLGVLAAAAVSLGAHGLCWLPGPPALFDGPGGPAVWVGSFGLLLDKAVALGSSPGPPTATPDATLPPAGALCEAAAGCTQEPGLIAGPRDLGSAGSLLDPAAALLSSATELLDLLAVLSVLVLVLALATGTAALIAELGDLASRGRREPQEPEPLIPTAAELGWEEGLAERGEQDGAAAAAAFEESERLADREASLTALRAMRPEAVIAARKSLGSARVGRPDGALPPWSAKLRMGVLNGGLYPLLPPLGEVQGPRAAEPSALLPWLPLEAQAAWSVALPRLRSEDERALLRDVLRLLAAETNRILDTQRFWARKELLVSTLAGMGADAILMAAALLFDVDGELGLSWEKLRPEVAALGPLGTVAAALVQEKRELGQVASLYYLKALMPQDDGGRGSDEWKAVSQLLSQMAVQAAGDYRALLLEVTAMALSLGERAVATELTPGGQPGAATRALARTALELHAPLTHALGFDALVQGHAAGVMPLPNCWTLTGALEHLGLWMAYPSEYRVIVDWYQHELGLLERTLEQGIDVVRRALDTSRGFARLAEGYKTKGRVKQPQSTMKKLLRGQRINDLLGMEVVIAPSKECKSPSTGVTISDARSARAVVGEAACCFAAAAAIQSFSSKPELGWVLSPESVKDYITQPKKSGYQAIHMTLITNMSAPPLRGPEQRGKRAIVKLARCKLEIHIFTESMKWEERHGSASHPSYKAFPMRPKNILEALDDESDGAISIGDIAHDTFHKDEWGCEARRAEDTLRTLADKAGYDDGGCHIELEDLERGRDEVDEVVAFFHGTASGAAERRLLVHPEELHVQAGKASSPRRLALPEPRPAAEDGAPKASEKQ